MNISLNGKNIQSVDNCYTYRAYLETLLNFSEESKDSQLKSIMFDADKSPASFLTNDGWIERSKRIAGSKINEVYGKIHCDMFNQPLLLLSNMDLRIKLILNHEDFYMLTEKADNDSFCKILDSGLYIKAVNLNPSLFLSHQLMLETNLASYYYKKVELKTFTVFPGTQSCNLHNVSIGVLPSKIFFFMCEEKSFSGMKNQTALNFKHNYMSSISLNVNSMQIPLDPIVMDFKSNVTARAYSTLFSSIGTFYTHASHLITKEMFEDGYTIIGFDLESCNSAVGGNLQNQGNLSLNATFAESLKNTTQCICYLQYSGCVKIDKNRNVTVC